MRPSRPLALAAALSLGACVPPARPPVAPVTPPPAPAPLPAPAPAPPDWRDASLAPGAWRYGGGAATFGTPGAARVTLRCTPARRVTLMIAGAAAGPLSVRTTSIARTVAARPAAGGAVTELAAADRLIDAMGYSRGRVRFEPAGAAPFAVPAHPEILRVAEDCR